jgi:hypothetical protein
MRNHILAALAMAFLSLSFGAAAGPDAQQQQAVQRLHEAKQKLAAAEKAKGEERRKLMPEHMTMMGETMGKMRELKPREDMTPQPQKEWIDEHQKLMQTMMDQMMDEHHMLMMGCK